MASPGNCVDFACLAMVAATVLTAEHVLSISKLVFLMAVLVAVIIRKEISLIIVTLSCRICLFGRISILDSYFYLV